MRKIAVIGLGIMGHGMAHNFLKSGYEVYVWNRHPDKADDLKGAKICGSPKEAAAQADIVFEVTANDESSEEIWLGRDGILAGADSKKYLIASPTLSVNWVNKLVKECQQRKLTFFDMPLTGGRRGAENGELILLAGGDKSKLNKIKPDLKAIAKSVRYFGPVGSGAKYKLLLNTMQGIIVSGFGEIMRMAKEAGLDQEVVGESLSELPGGYTLSISHASFQKEPKPINFSLAWETKDLNYASQMAQKGEYPLRDVVVKKYNDALKQGYGEDDFTKVNKI